MLSGEELNLIYTLTGAGKYPVTGGPAGSLKSPIAQTIPFDAAGFSSLSPSNGVMDLTSISLPVNKTITNINFFSANTGEATGTHLWFALYDDGRGSSVAGQLALLGQTPDQTGATAFAANTNLGLSLAAPVTTQYSGIYYVGFMCASSGTVPTLCGVARGTTASITITANGGFYCATAGSSLVGTAPSPSGALSVGTRMAYAYVS